MGVGMFKFGLVMLSAVALASSAMAGDGAYGEPLRQCMKLSAGSERVECLQKVGEAAVKGLAAREINKKCAIVDYAAKPQLGMVMVHGTSNCAKGFVTLSLYNRETGALLENATGMLQGGAFTVATSVDPGLAIEVNYSIEETTF